MKHSYYLLLNSIKDLGIISSFFALLEQLSLKLLKEINMVKYKSRSNTTGYFIEGAK
jgi:hypothetical protein